MLGSFFGRDHGWIRDGTMINQFEHPPVGFRSTFGAMKSA